MGAGHGANFLYMVRKKNTMDEIMAVWLTWPQPASLSWKEISVDIV
jgi:hypothetical protein